MRMEAQSVLGPVRGTHSRTNGQQEIAFVTFRIMFALAKRFQPRLQQRGRSVFDEAQILTVRAMDSMVPVLNTSLTPGRVYGHPTPSQEMIAMHSRKRMHALNHDRNLST